MVFPDPADARHPSCRRITASFWSSGKRGRLRSGRSFMKWAPRSLAKSQARGFQFHEGQGNLLNLAIGVDLRRPGQGADFRFLQSSVVKSHVGQVALEEIVLAAANAERLIHRQIERAPFGPVGG